MSCIKHIKKIAKRIIDYRIEGDKKVYTLKHTPIKISLLMTKYYEKNLADLPVVNNKIVFDNYAGGGYGCNGKYITKALSECENVLDIVWVVKDVNSNRDSFPKGVRLVEYMSKEAFYEYATAKVWVCNFQMVAYINKGLRKKKEQVYIQTWHGSFGIKKIENDCRLLNCDRNWMELAKMNSLMTDYWISNSEFETDIYRRSFWNVRSVLEYGHPRNDIFFDKELMGQVKSKFDTMTNGRKRIVYVPTFRDNKNIEGFNLDYEKVIKAFEEKYHDRFVMMIRMHPKMRGYASKVIKESDNIMDVTDYPDIQELLAAADAVITDYSSAVFDYLLMRKPGFLFVTDEKGYEDQRGLYYPLTETPFPVSHTNEELVSNIMNFEQAVYEKKAAEFLKGKGSFETGQASKKVAKLIIDIVDNNLIS